MTCWSLLARLCAVRVLPVAYEGPVHGSARVTCLRWAGDTEREPGSQRFGRLRRPIQVLHSAGVIASIVCDVFLFQLLRRHSAQFTGISTIEWYMTVHKFDKPEENLKDRDRKSCITKASVPRANFILTTGFWCNLGIRTNDVRSGSNLQTKHSEWPISSCSEILQRSSSAPI
jgi:hypothetical protein